ncbi:hypothetical protein VE25_06220 [Devosia geojensis]|uniref:Bcr/CflA family efflux transporter n=1 Tax=Devosia geojensis TaxID=443610 RepID=A0A0F5FWI9_9HYPH|nr:multidrug effflux MFS transporter [Devosia geojensis]KKB12527.1 hypothetical protein VE25_06220 [Devosia geojensis]
MTASSLANTIHHGPWLTALLSLLLGFASISTDLYLPALPTMSVALGADRGTLELTVSSYLLGFSLGQLFWGPVSDRYGRKLPLLCGLAIFIAGAAGCALSTGAWRLVGWRVVQALGASAAFVIGRAMVRDLFDRNDAARMLSTLMMIMGIAPLLGPTIGAQILAISSWQYISWSLVGMRAVTFAAVCRLAEPLPPARREHGALLGKFATYLEHLRNPALMLYAGILGFSAAGLFAYVAGSAFVFIQFYGLSAEVYGLVFASSIVGIMLANAVNRRLLPRYGSDRLMLAGAICGGVAAFFVALLAWTGWGGMAAFLVALWFFVAMGGMIGANAVAGGLTSVVKGTGSASALLGCAQYGGGMIGAGLVSALSQGTPAPLGLVVLMSSLAAGACAIAIARRLLAEGATAPT